MVFCHCRALRIRLRTANPEALECSEHRVEQLERDSRRTRPKAHPKDLFRSWGPDVSLKCLAKLALRFFPRFPRVEEGSANADFCSPISATVKASSDCRTKHIAAECLPRLFA